LTRSKSRTLRDALTVFALALVLRLAFVAWAPRVISGDAIWYHAYASAISSLGRYVEIDGSPAIQWLPGWPLLLAALYRITGASSSAGMLLNAVLGAVTAALVVALGARLFRREVGAIAGVLYAIWPGTIMFSATLMSETAFCFFLVASLVLLCRGASEAGPRPLSLIASGLTFGAAALVKAEAWVLVPVLCLFLAASLRSVPAFGRAVAAFLLAAAVVLAPWVARNHQQFDRVLLTSASGGMNAWLGNHERATGGENFKQLARYLVRHEKPTRAETYLTMNDAGWQDAWHFARSDPGRWLRLAATKVARTYRSDDGGARMVRGARKRQAALDLNTHRVLARVANTFWWLALALAVIGLASLRYWSRPARILVLGWPASWLALHLVFIGDPRFHVPEIPALSLWAAWGALLLAERAWGRLGRWVGPASR